MPNISRRGFLKVAGLLGAAGIPAGKAQAAPKNILTDERMGVLVDTTLCIGCRRCEYACQKAHELPVQPIESYDDRAVFEQMRRPDTHSLTVINEYPAVTEDSQPVNVKVQCMHCDHPACVSACIVGALTKEESGAVVWDPGKCIGCRYCMVACPFQIPAFEYEKAIQPRILKCDFCHTRTREGLLPACVDTCPVQALTYGRRYDLIEIARRKIEAEPERYVNHIYGEHEVAGTSWLYMAAKDFSSLDFPKLTSSPAPGATESIQHAIFKYFIPPMSLFALLGGIMWINRKQQESAE